MFLYPAFQKLEFQKKDGHEDYYYRKYLPKDKNLFEYDYLLSPVNIDNTHWILMVIDLVFLELIIYDSLIRDNDNPMYQKVFDIFTKLTRVDKSTGWKWYYVCPKRWLKTAKSCQCLSPKSGFFTSVAAPPRLAF